MIKYLKNEDYQEIIKEGKWLVDFYADWCGPCKMLGKVLESVDANILKINVDEHENLAATYGVMSIPTMCFFSNGELKEKQVGFKSKEEIEDILRNLD